MPQHVYPSPPGISSISRTPIILTAIKLNRSINAQHEYSAFMLLDCSLFCVQAFLSKHFYRSVVLILQFLSSVTDTYLITSHQAH
jgi:hypothetical protein